MSGAAAYGEIAEAAWRWVLGQVRWDDQGPWIPEYADGECVEDDRDGMHNGIGGLAHALAEIRLTRSWTADEERLAGAIADRISSRIPEQDSITYFDGLVSSIGVLTALAAPGAASAVLRLEGLAAPDGWPQSFLVPPKYQPDARINDATLGTGSVLLGALWARRNGVAADQLANRAAEVLLAEGVELPTGVNWPFVPERFRNEPGADMPNFSHGLAGIAAAIAVAGVELGRPELVEVAHRGAEHLITLGVTDSKGFRVARVIPWGPEHGDEFTYNWCHGGAGTSLLFLALDYAGVGEVAGESPLTRHRRCLDSVRNSGVPERLWPGFWDNDGRCCGTAGVADVFLDSWIRAGDEADLEFARRLADTLVSHAIVDADGAYWRFIEHKNAEPLLSPGVGWMQGAAGIAAYLLRFNRTLRDGRAAAVTPRMETWWTLGRTGPTH